MYLVAAVAAVVAAVAAVDPVAAQQLRIQLVVGVQAHVSEHTTRYNRHTKYKIRTQICVQKLTVTQSHRDKHTSNIL